MTTGECAATLVEPGWVVGLGSGKAASAFTRVLAARVAAGLQVRGVSTSLATARLANQLGIPLTTLDEVQLIDLTVDGADEVDPSLNLIKGRGGALVREKIVAASSRRLIVLVGAEKLVSTLGLRGILPVEVVPFGLALCRQRLFEMGYPATVRRENGLIFVSDNGNQILDCKVTAIPEPTKLESAIKSIPGVVGTGLFLGMAQTVLVQEGDQVRTLGMAPSLITK
jgi:ribose 5-phosphate isomerase A